MGKTGNVQWLDHNFTTEYKQKFCSKKCDMNKCDPSIIWFDKYTILVLLPVDQK